MEIKTLAGWHEYAETHAGSCSMEGFERGCRMKTLTDLKRDAGSGRLSLELYAWHGKTGDGIPERIRGIRKVSSVNTVCLKLLSADGTESELRFVRAKLLDYDDKSLIIFAPAHREPTEEERAVQAGAEKIMEESPHDWFWKVKDYYRKSPCPWMAPYGEKMIKGKRYLAHEDKVLDYAVRGDAILRYIVHMKLEEAA